MKILITGITGFVGNYLANYLFSLGHFVVGVGRKSIKDNYFFKYYQKRFIDSIDIDQNIDVIVHAAGQSCYNATCIKDFINGNILTAKAVADLAVKKKIKLIIYLSSVSIYGEIKASVIDEKTPIINPGIYGMTKYLGEKIFEEIAIDIPCIALRLPGIIGVGAHSCWLAKVNKKAQQGLEISINNPTGLFNNVINCEDLSNFISCLLNKKLNGFDAITLGAVNSMRIDEIVWKFVNKYNSISKIKIEKDNHDSFIISIDRAKHVYGYCGSKMENIIDTYLMESSH